MVLLSDLIDLDLSNSTEKIIVEYIRYYKQRFKLKKLQNKILGNETAAKIGRMRSKKKTVAIPDKEIGVHQQNESLSYEGENLVGLLKSIQREIESARVLDKALRDKIWLKQLFSIGVNDVTRVLERMPPVAAVERLNPVLNSGNSSSKASPVKLQAVLAASDCNPRWLTKHLPSLASSRKVPLIFVKDKKGGSLRLGELVKLKSAIAVGVKARGNAINNLIENILRDQRVQGGVPPPESLSS